MIHCTVGGRVALARASQSLEGEEQTMMMLGIRGERDRTEGILLLLAVTLALGLLGSLVLGGALGASPRSEWARVLGVGDTLAQEGGTTAVPGQGPPGSRRVTARSAYLLALHEAQDAEDVPRMLIVADRLARLGEWDLAAHARRAARVVAAELAAEAAARWRITRTLRII